jgi:hypothetical protein
MPQVYYLYRYIVSHQRVVFFFHPSLGYHSTSAMLKVLYAEHKAPAVDLSFQEMLLKMRDVLSQGKYEQIPQLSASRPLDIQ